MFSGLPETVGHLHRHHAAACGDHARHHDRGFHHDLAAFDFLDAPIHRITTQDTPLPYAPTFVEAFLPSVKKIIDANSGMATSAYLGKVQQGGDIPGRKSAVDRGNTIYTIPQADAQEFRRKARQVEVEWVDDMNKRGFDGRKLLDTARSLIDKHTKATKPAKA